MGRSDEYIERMAAAVLLAILFFGAWLLADRQQKLRACEATVGELIQTEAK